MNARAISVAVAVGVAASLALGVLFRLFPVTPGGDRMGLFIAISYGFGAIVDILTGAVAGGLARRSGAAHGLVAGAIAMLASWLLGWGMTLWQYRDAEVIPIEFWRYVLAVLPAGLIGLLLATVAGLIAARVVTRHGRA